MTRRARTLALASLVALGGWGCGTRGSGTGGTTHGAEPAERASCDAPPSRREPAQARLVLQRAHTDSITRMTMSESGLLATASYRDKSVRVWDVDSGALISVIREPFDANIAWRDGQLVLGGANEQWTVRVDGTLTGTAPRAVTSDFVRGAGGYRAWSLEPNYQRNVLVFRNPAGEETALRVEADGRQIPVVSLTLEDVQIDRDARVIVASISMTDILLVWQADEPEPVARVVRLGVQRPSFALSPDGSEIAVIYWHDSQRGRMAVFSTATTKTPPRTVDLPSTPRRVAYAPDGGRIVVSLYDGVIGVDAESLTPRWRHERPTFDDATRRFLSGNHQEIAFTHDSELVAVSVEDGAIDVFDAATGRRQRRMGAEVRAPTRLVFAGDETLIALAPDHLTAWSLSDARPRTQVDVHGIHRAFMTDGDLVTLRLASCYGTEQLRMFFDRWDAWDPPGEIVRAADVEDPICTGHPATTTPPAWSPTPSRRGAYATVVEYPAPPPIGQWLEVDPRSRVGLVSAGVRSKWRVVDLDTGRLSDIDFGETIYRSGLRLDHGLVTAWLTPKTSERDPRTGHTIYRTGVAVWDARTGERLAWLELDREHLRGIPSDQIDAIAPDRRRAVAAKGAHATVFALPSGERQWTLAHDARISALAFAGDRVVAGARDGSLVVQRRGEPAIIGRSTGGAIRTIAVAPSKTIAATTSDDGSVRIWDLDDGTMRAALVDFDDDEYIAFTPGGYYAGTREAATRVRWVFADPVEAFAFEQFARELDRPEHVRARLRGEGGRGEPVALWRPPAVDVLEAPPATTGASEVTVRVRARSAGHVERVRLFADGRGVDEALVCAAEGEVSLRAPLQAGLTRLTIQAYDERGYASNTAGLDVASTAQASSRDLWLVAVGVSRYPKLAARYQLAFADDDARGIAGALAAAVERGDRYERLRATVLVDTEVTRRSVLDAVAALEEMRPQDTAVVFLAGHGVKLGGDGEMVFLTADDALEDRTGGDIGIRWDDIAGAIASAPGRVVVLLDACHSGHVSQDLLVPNDSLAHDLMRRRSAGAFVFAAAKGRQLSYEPSGARSLIAEETRAPGSVAGHGLFTQAVIDAVADRATDRDADGAVQLSELVSSVTATVHAASRGHQTPWVARREMIGDFALLDPAGERPDE